MKLSKWRSWSEIITTRVSSKIIWPSPVYQEEIEFEGDAEDYSGLNQALQIISEVFDSDDDYNVGTFGKASHGKCPNVKFRDGQWWAW